MTTYIPSLTRPLIYCHPTVGTTLIRNPFYVAKVKAGMVKAKSGH